MAAYSNLIENKGNNAYHPNSTSPLSANSKDVQVFQLALGSSADVSTQAKEGAAKLDELQKEFHRHYAIDKDSEATRKAREAFNQAKSVMNSNGVTANKNDSSSSSQQSNPDMKKAGGFLTIDDLNTDPSKMEPIFQFLKRHNLPAIFFPINEKSRIDDMKNVELNLARARELGLNFKIGQHGYSGDKLDPLMQGANGKTIAWPYGNVVVDKLPHDAVARGVRCGVNQWGSFDQHNLNSCTVSSNPKEIATRRDKIEDVKENGGSIGFHMHNSDGFSEFKEDYENLKKAGAEFIFMDELIGKGAGKQ